MNRILIVDDHPENLYLLRTLLQSQGAGVDEARHGAEALAKARQTPPDLVITDLLMPVMDGYALLRHWKTDERLKTIPFIVYTATYTDPKDEQLALALLGADGFIIKPAEPEFFLARIREVLAPGRDRLAAGEKEVLLEQYNQVLIHKLEAKMRQLETANQALQQDIAKRQQAEEKLRRQADLLDLAQDAIFVRDLADRVTFWNQGAEQHYGISAAAALGQVSQALLATEFPRPLAEINAELAARGLWEGELRHKTRSGQMLTVSSRWSLQRDAAGAPQAVLEIDSDITTRKQAEAKAVAAEVAGHLALVESEKRWRALFENMSAGFVLFEVVEDDHGRPVDLIVLAANQGFEQATGLKKQEVIGQRLVRVLPGIEQDAAGWIQIYGQVAQTGADRQFEHSSERLGRHYSVTAYQAGPKQCAVTFVDITGRKQAEEALRHSEATVRRKLAAITEPEGDISELALADIVDTKLLQSILEDFYRLTGMLGAVLDVSGEILVAVGWQDICTQFHRCHPEACKNCVESDTILTRDVPAGTFKAYHCKNHMWDVVTPLIVGDRHVGNVFIGQFLYKGEEPDVELFREQARHYGFNEAEYLAALARVPRFTREEVEAGMHFYSKLAGVISQLSFSMIQQSRMLADRQRAEAALQESERRFRALFEQAAVGVAQLAPDGRFLEINQRFCDIIGYAHEEICDRNFQAITHPDDLAADLKQMRRMLANEIHTYALEKRYYRKDGECIWVNLSVSLVREPTGEPKYFVSVVEDISARKRAEAERSRLFKAIEQMAEMVLVTDLAGTILYTNPAFEKISGYTCAEVLGQNPRRLKSGKHDAEFYRQLWETLKRGEVWHGHFINRRKDGALLEQEATISPVRDASGVIVNYVAVCRDVTREQELERRVLQSQKMEVIGQLAGGVAHDFNNILAAMMMELSLADTEKDLPGEIREILGELKASVERAANLTRQLLLFSRRQVMQPVDLDLNELVTGLAKMIQRLISEEVRLELKLHPAPLLTHADAGMLDQVLMNLAVNARDAMPNGGRLVIETGSKLLDETGLGFQPEAVPGRYVVLSVSDTGAGISPEVMPHIFEPFFTTKAVGKGTGLGLATVFGIVKQHGGWIKVYSEPQRGTHFQIFLPACKEADHGRATSFPQFIPRGGTETILLVEDERPVRVATRMVLERHGYHVLEAAHGVEASNVFAAHPGRIHLLLTDLVMPEGVGGRELATRLLERDPNLRVIFTSGYSGEIAGRELNLQPGQCFLQKPSPPKELLETVHRILNH